MLDDHVALRMQCEILFLLEDIDDGKKLETETLFRLLEEAVVQARQRGLEKLRVQQAEFLSKSLQGGAGQAHRMVNVDNALPSLRRTVPTKEEDGSTRFESAPLEVAKIYATPWKNTWVADSPDCSERI